MSAYAEHRAAIESGRVSKSNVMGIRKALDANARRARALSTSSTCPNVAPLECEALQMGLEHYKPLVCGDLHESGLRVLQSRRYAKRWTDEQRAIIADAAAFRLVRFDWLDSLHCNPVYQVETADGRAFCFRVVPWQTAAYMGLESGPVSVGRLHT